MLRTNKKSIEIHWKLLLSDQIVKFDMICLPYTDGTADDQLERKRPVPAPRMKTLDEYHQEEVTMRMSTWTMGDVPEVSEKRLPPTLPPKAPQTDTSFKERLTEQLSRRQTNPVRPRTMSSEEDTDGQGKRDSKEEKAKNEPPYTRLPFSNNETEQEEVAEKGAEPNLPDDAEPGISRDRLATYPFVKPPLPKRNRDNDWMDPG